LGARLLLHTSSDQRGRRRSDARTVWPRSTGARGAAMAKEWRYQWRSPMRRTQAIIGVALSMGFAVLQTLPLDDPPATVIYAGMMGLLFSANNAFNVVGFDSHSLWLEFTAAGGLRRHQLEARLLSYGAGTMLGLVLAGLAVGVATGQWGELPIYLALTPTGVLCLLGVGAVVSAAWPLTAIDGDNPFKKPTGANGCGYALAVLGAMASLAVLLAPIALPLVLFDGWWRIGVAAGGWIWGWFVWRTGVSRGVARLDRHGPDLLAELSPRLGT
ncbi:MAG TPA: hypothetical protein DCR14_00690, partial [Acidimicrobiaceae bacterium]|nr:hypothetical protein [Acidimicrobiaceae bacterium]